MSSPIQEALSILGNAGKTVANFINSDYTSQQQLYNDEQQTERVMKYRQQTGQNGQPMNTPNTNSTQQPQTNTNPVQQALNTFNPLSVRGGANAQEVQSPVSQVVQPATATPTPTQQPMATPTPVQGAIQSLTPTPTPLPASMVPKGANPLEASTGAGVVPLFEQAKIPGAIGMGIWAEEGHGVRIPNVNNPWNIGAFDSNPNNAKNYPFKTPIDGGAAAVKFLQGQSPYQDATKKAIFQKAYQQLQKNNDPEAYLKAIGPTYSSNKNWATDVMNTPEYRRWAGGN